jgi:hypothetical protein
MSRELFRVVSGVAEFGCKFGWPFSRCEKVILVGTFKRTPSVGLGDVSESRIFFSGYKLRGLNVNGGEREKNL